MMEASYAGMRRSNSIPQVGSLPISLLGACSASDPRFLDAQVYLQPVGCLVTYTFRFHLFDCLNVCCSAQHSTKVASWCQKLTHCNGSVFCNKRKLLQNAELSNKQSNNQKTIKPTKDQTNKQTNKQTKDGQFPRSVFWGAFVTPQALLLKFR